MWWVLQVSYPPLKLEKLAHHLEIYLVKRGDWIIHEFQPYWYLYSLILIENVEAFRPWTPAGAAPDNILQAVAGGADRKNGL